MHDRPLKVSVILPTLNEAENIVPLIEAIFEAMPDTHEVLVVDDHSPDGTADRVRKLNHQRVHVIERLKDHGLTKSIWEGVQKATGDCVVWMDCDFSMPPSLIPGLVEQVRNGKDIAVGSRFLRGGSAKRNTSGTADSPLGVLLSSALNYFLRFLLDPSFTDYTSGFIAARKEVVTSLGLRGDYGEYFIDFMYRAIRGGYQFVEIPYVCVPRKHGVSKTGQGILDYAKRGRLYLKVIVDLRLNRA